MSNKRISELKILESRPNDNDLIPIVHNGETMAVEYLNITGPQGPTGATGASFLPNDGLFTGAPVRTIYTRSNIVSYTAGSPSVDLLSGDVGSTFGNREITSDFLSGQFLSKLIYFRTFGMFSNNTGSVNVSIMIGDDVLTSSNLGTIALTQPQNHPFEIFGEIIFNDGNVTTCYSIGHCANNGDFKRYPLSNPTILQDVNNFNSGEIKLMFSSSNLGVSTYGGYVQVLS